MFLHCNICKYIWMFSDGKTQISDQMLIGMSRRGIQVYLMSDVLEELWYSFLSDDFTFGRDYQ
jgi:hypothetical protein